MSSALARNYEIRRYAFQPLYWPAQIEAWQGRRTHRTRSEVLLWPDHTRRARRAKPLPVALPWPDRAGLVAACIVAALAVFSWVVVFLAAETVTYGRLNDMLASWTLAAELAFALPFWLGLRVIDFLSGGPCMRRQAAKDRRIEPPLDAKSFPE